MLNNIFKNVQDSRVIFILKNVQDSHHHDSRPSHKLIENCEFNNLIDILTLPPCELKIPIDK